MSEVDENGRVLATFIDADYCPIHMTIDSKGHLLVADFGNHRILLLTPELQLQRILINTDSAVSLREPARLFFNELTSHLYVVHNYEWSSCIISTFSLR